MFHSDIEALRTAGCHKDFVAACRDIVENSDIVQIETTDMNRVVPLVQDYQAASWDSCVRDPSADIKDIWFDLVFTSALNGGYFYADEDTDDIRQWQENGSGSKALFSWFHEIADKQLLPVQGDFSDSNRYNFHRRQIEETLFGVPYADQRLAIIEEFMEGNTIDAMNFLLNRLVLRDGKYVGTLGFADAVSLAALFPEGFGRDPFRKKAILAVMMLASHMVSRGHDIRCNVPIPSDYQIPRILEYLGYIKLNGGLRKAIINGDRLLDAGSTPVTEFRAAAVVIANDIAVRIGRPDWMVDGALFNGLRNDRDFKEGSLPPMKIYGMWF